MNKVPRWVFRYVGNKTFDFSSKKIFVFIDKNGFINNWLQQEPPARRGQICNQYFSNI